VKKQHRSQKGFTLMEMVMVLVVVGLLVSIIVPKFTGQLGDAKAAATKANLESLRSAIGLYAKYDGNPPANLAALASDPVTPDGKTIIRSVPTDAWNVPFIYPDANGDVSCDMTNSPECDENW